MSPILSLKNSLFLAYPLRQDILLPHLAVVEMYIMGFVAEKSEFLVIRSSTFIRELGTQRIAILLEILYSD